MATYPICPSLTLSTSHTSHSNLGLTTLPLMLQLPSLILSPQLYPLLHRLFHLSSGFRPHLTPQMTPPSSRLLPSLQRLSISLTRTFHSPCMVVSSPSRTLQRLRSRRSSQTTSLASTILSPSRPPSSSSLTISHTPHSPRHIHNPKCSTTSR